MSYWHGDDDPTSRMSFGDDDPTSRMSYGPIILIVLLVLLLIGLRFVWVLLRKKKYDRFINVVLQDGAPCTLDTIHQHLTSLGYSLIVSWTRTPTQAVGTVVHGDYCLFCLCPTFCPRFEYDLTFALAPDRTTVVACQGILDRMDGCVTYLFSGLIGLCVKNKETENLHRLFAALTLKQQQGMSVIGFGEAPPPAYERAVAIEPLPTPDMLSRVA